MTPQGGGVQAEVIVDHPSHEDGQGGCHEQQRGRRVPEGEAGVHRLAGAAGGGSRRGTRGPPPLVSPAMAAAAAVNGKFTDIRTMA